MPTYSDARYLEAKRTVDDRALNKDVLRCLREELAQRGDQMLHVFEVGAGIGTMATRLLDWQLLKRAEYTLLDQDPQLLELARQRLTSWAAEHGHEVVSAGDGLIVRGSALDLSVHFVAAELGEFLQSSAEPHDADLLVANAFLDIVDVASTLPKLFQRAARGGLYWFCINFDGESILLPEHADDPELFRIYHQSMDERVRRGRGSGDSKTGRHLFGHLASCGASVLAAGASDWVVHPTAGRYTADEGYFLQHILHTIEQELASSPQVARATLAAWSSERRAQIERSELCFIAHQLDFFGRITA
jgi:hypothetical protein